MMSSRNFLALADCTPEELERILDRAIELKRLRREGILWQPLRAHVLALVFTQHSTRTRVALEAGMAQLGGSSIVLTPQDAQFGRHEPLSHTALVLSSMVDVVAIRTSDPTWLTEFAANATVPVINAMTAADHPCQLLADLQTYRELRGSIRGRTVAFVGDGHNMCNAYVHAAQQFGFRLRIACPSGYAPDTALLAGASAYVQQVADPAAAVAGADLVVTDAWCSMGQEQERDERLRAFASFQVSPSLLDMASPDALFMHCLPAHPGEEITPEVLDDPRSVVWQEAENRLHTHKALFEFLLCS